MSNATQADHCQYALRAELPFYYSIRPRLFSLLDDKSLSLLAPICVYWISASFFHILDVSGLKCIERYRIHESPADKSRNKVSLNSVIRSIVLQQVLQTVLGIAVMYWESEESISLAEHAYAVQTLSASMRTFGRQGEERPTLELAAFVYWWVWPAVQLVLALLIFDAWQYFGHRLFHAVPFLYRNFHSVHHRLNVSYAYGALYNHPVEAFFLDAIGTLVAYTVPGLSVRQNILFFCFITLKCVDDHCGFNFPWDPLQRFCGSNAAFHDIHHQPYGIKSNFSQSTPFAYLDKLCGTFYNGKRANRPPSEEKQD